MKAAQRTAVLGDPVSALQAVTSVIRPVGESEAVNVPAARAVSGTVVSRPELFGRLSEAQRVIQVSAPAGSGKTVLLRSWIADADLAERAAWVPVGRDERDPRRFWVAVVGALRGTAAGAALVRPLTAAPDLDCWAVVERLLTDLAPLARRQEICGWSTGSSGWVPSEPGWWPGSGPTAT